MMNQLKLVDRPKKYNPWEAKPSRVINDDIKRAVLQYRGEPFLKIVKKVKKNARKTDT